ncbi:MAG: ABC transporter ATP-binding protein [Geminicoccaceae bacterium]|nr:MAG: ABC transporter ATP-binding protein [Geminicoccaceae bacterium]
MSAALLEVQDLTITFRTDAGTVHPAKGVSFEVAQGEVVGLVGESGSGKSMTAKAVLGLVEPARAVRSAHIRYKGRDLNRLSAAELFQLRARDLAMIFQDPMGSLNPLFTIGHQLTRVYLQHGPREGSARERKRAARARAVELLKKVRIPDPESRLGQYPHQFSGGMRQRVMIAMALMCSPTLLVADEPTTALDVTVELQVVELLKSLQAELGMSVIFISHNLGVVARLCDRVMVMYAGRIVESGPVDRVLVNPAHPYTRALLASMPRGRKDEAPLRPIQGEPPSLARLAPGCPFRPRCDLAGAGCEVEQKLVTVEPRHQAACHRVRAA